MRINPLLVAVLLVMASVVWLDPFARSPGPGPSVGLMPPVHAATRAPTAAVGHAPSFDPFWRDQHAAGATPAPAESAPIAVAPPVIAPTLTSASPPPVSRPQLPFRFFGRMQTPDGRSLVLLSRDKDIYSVQPGLLLDDYRITDVTLTRVTFEYVPTGDTMTLDLPTPQGQQQ